MTFDTHVHAYGFPSLQKLEPEIRCMEDGIAFRIYPSNVSTHQIFSLGVASK